MEDVRLIDTSTRTTYFHRGVVANIRYWQSWVADKLVDVPAVDRERDNIIKAITFALNLETATWLAVNQLIIDLFDYIESWGHWDSWNQVLHNVI